MNLMQKGAFKRPDTWKRANGSRFGSVQIMRELRQKAKDTRAHPSNSCCVIVSQVPGGPDHVSRWCVGLLRIIRNVDMAVKVRKEAYANPESGDERGCSAWYESGGVMFVYNRVSAVSEKNYTLGGLRIF